MACGEDLNLAFAFGGFALLLRSGDRPRACSAADDL